MLTDLRFLLWLLVAMAPAVFVLSTWEPGGVRNPSTDWTRLLGLPVVGTELAVIALAFCLGEKPLRTLRKRPLWVYLSLAALVGISIYTTAIARAPFISLCWTLITLIHVLFALAVYALARTVDGDAQRAIWPTITAGVGLYVILLALFAFSLPHPSTFNWETLRFGTTNIRHLGHYAIVGASGALALASFQKGWRRLVYASFAAAMFAMAFWSGTRGAILATIVAFLLAQPFSPKLRSTRAWLILVGAIVAGAMLSLLVPASNHILGINRMAASVQAGSLTSGRLDLWSSTLSTIAQRPLFGFGAGQFMWVVPAANGAFYHPHNIVLQLLLQWGLVGTALVLSLSAYLVWVNRQVLQSLDAPGTAALLVALSILTLAATDGALFFSYPTMMFAFSIAFLFGRRRSSS